jgi:hypothetical protein
MPAIFRGVKTSLKMINDAVKINIYTSAVATGTMYPRSFFDIRYI